MILTGLYGAQFTLKLKIINGRHFPDAGGAKILKRLLDAMDRVLNSILAALQLDHDPHGR